MIKHGLTLSDNSWRHASEIIDADPLLRMIMNSESLELEQKAEQEALAAVEAANPEKKYEVFDGFIYDADDGTLVMPAWDKEIKTADDAEKVMAAMLRCEVNFAAEQARAATIVENCKKIAAVWARRRAELARKYEETVIAIGKAEMKKLKKKTWQTPFGKVQSKDVVAGLETDDIHKAKAFLNRFKGSRGAVRPSFSILLPEIAKKERDALIADEKFALANGFRVKPAYTSTKLTTSPPKTKKAAAAATDEEAQADG